jgi:hypothetical protein
MGPDINRNGTTVERRGLVALAIYSAIHNILSMRRPHQSKLWVALSTRPRYPEAQVFLHTSGALLFQPRAIHPGFIPQIFPAGSLNVSPCASLTSSAKALPD